jgi:glycosyltransferase involved in cell wall biosynthesis
MPMDSTLLDESWFEHFDIVDRIVAYTEFGKSVMLEAKSDLDIQVIPHGVDRDTFFKLPQPKEEIKASVFPSEDYADTWVVLNANRNQPRKRIDIAFEGFAIFAKDKPMSVRYYHHAGISDVGYDILRLARKLGRKYEYNVEERLIVTNMHRGTQSVPEDKLNAIYNATDVGINTSLGEGWGLTNIEHAMTGAPQIVPDHSACRELFQDVGLLIPTSQEICFEQTLTYGQLVTPQAVAEQLEIMYNNPELSRELAAKALDKFNKPAYSWKNIAKTWHKLFLEVL